MNRLVFGLGWKPFVALVAGLLALILLIYFYVQQRGFEYNYKEVRNRFHTIDRSYHRLNYEILRSALFAYSNQDLITNEVQRLDREYAILSDSSYLKRPAYSETAAAVKKLQERIKRFESDIEEFMLLNAGIKNSFVFITSLSADKVELFKSRPQAYGRLLSVIAQVSQARMLGDADFLHDLEARALPLAQEKGLSDEQSRLMRSLMIHIHFISQNYPDFVRAHNRIESSELDKAIEHTETLFLQEARNDVALLDRFVTVLFLLFLLALILIVALLIRTDRENRRLRELEERLRHSLSHDQLTGLKSRIRFEATQNTFEKPTLLLLNVDHFKRVNDFYGSAAGNTVLKEIALLIRQPVLETYDPEFFRLGGDDFGIVLQNIDLQRAHQMAELLKYSVESFAFTYEEIEIFITVSVAVNCIPPLLENADLVLKHARERRSESVVIFSENMHLKEQAEHNIAMTYELKKALDRDAVFPWFQPIMELQSGKVLKYEALVRMQDESGHIHGPGHFLATALQTPYYPKITAVMLEKVFKAMNGYHFRISVNLGMRDLQNDKLVSMLIGMLESNREKASRLDFELLESEELDDLEAVRSFIAKVKSFGCRIAIDDFGSGYSNFAYVMDLDIDILKIDGSLVSKIGSDERVRNGVVTIAQFARQMGVAVTAEFVEDEATAELLRSMGIEYAQGYLYGRPEATFREEITDA